MTASLIITWPDGTVTTDRASGNTQRTLDAAVAALVKSYKLDGCDVEVRG